ncbi:MAG: transcription antitermination factor NusB [Halobacteriovoraceae bacterium]|nr:transcription antitermination factor NusB [Halobacteriovoraceae bacterium]MCB9094181.1 transcription antitermination factor NusB [Halobacteriovoraceae bacterium]
MKNKSLARELSFKFYYHYIFSSEKDITLDFIENELEIFAETIEANPAQIDFIRQLAQPVSEHLSKIEELISQNLKSWKLERIAKIDLTLLVLGIAEMKYLNPPTPGKVVINECIELAKKYGTEDSKSFVNGLLDKIMHNN